MALSAKTKKFFANVIGYKSGDKAEAKELFDALETASTKATTVAAIGATADLAGADVATLRGEVEARLDVIEAKIDEILASLKAAGHMA